VIALPSSPLSVEQIAGELRISNAEAQARMHTIYRKLGVSSRRTAARPTSAACCAERSRSIHEPHLGEVDRGQTLVGGNPFECGREPQ
jgi:hypothetical protein